MMYVHVCTCVLRCSIFYLISQARATIIIEPSHFNAVNESGFLRTEKDIRVSVSCGRFCDYDHVKIRESSRRCQMLCLIDSRCQGVPASCGINLLI